jgi:dienelactone hydrolase
VETEHETTADGITERRITLRVDGATVPGLHWLPPGPAAPPATVLIGHGGTAHKRAPNVVDLARRLVLGPGYGAVALDAPAHGDRMTPEQRAALAARLAAARQDQAAGTQRGIPPEVWRAMLATAPRAVAEWQALLDGLIADGTAGPFGYWGVSMGTVYGVPLLAREPRITAAVLGLANLRDGDQAQREQAAAITIPLLFLLQADDPLVSREAGLALWDALGSDEKAVHLNPGPHAGVPAFERDAAVAFFQRHLGR